MSNTIAQKEDKYHSWTAEEIRTLAQIWESSTLKEACDRLGLRSAQVAYMVKQINKAGFPLKKKRQHGMTNSLIIAALDGLK